MSIFTGQPSPRELPIVHAHACFENWRASGGLVLAAKGQFFFHAGCVILASTLTADCVDCSNDISLSCCLLAEASSDLPDLRKKVSRGAMENIGFEVQRK